MTGGRTRWVLLFSLLPFVVAAAGVSDVDSDRARELLQRTARGGPQLTDEELALVLSALPGDEVRVDLGDEGRLPPELHMVGAKLTDAGFDDMLLGGQKYRTYMATRMPQFGKENIGALPQLFAKADAGKVPSHEPQFSARLVDQGRQLVGKKKLACINCHAWGPYRLPGAEGLDTRCVVGSPGWRGWRHPGHRVARDLFGRGIDGLAHPLRSRSRGDPAVSYGCR